MGPMRASAIARNTFPAMACMLLQTIVFLFTVVGTPLDVFRARPEVYGVLFCYSMWGSKECGSHTANPDKLPYKGFPSEPIEGTMNTAATFATLSNVFTPIAMALTVLLARRRTFRVMAGVFSATAFCTLLVCWVCMAVAYHKKATFLMAGFTFTAVMRDMVSYAAGFVLILVAWCLQTVEMALLLCM